MPDIISLLPDSVANQIAAGEVIQRPSSVVKELMENAIDAGATSIQLAIKDAGKTLIQVSDNGKAMSETDARLCFERHATSKIKEANDLFKIQTMGFRGEALASIAAIAHVELKTRQEHDETGTCILMEGSVLKSQQACACPKGTSIAVKNLFFNVPARRNFLKAETTESNHIIEQFQRIALAYPQVAFSMYHNDKEVFHLSPDSSLKQRIVEIFGDSFNRKIIPVELRTEFITISGFLGKPEFAKKTRGEQFFFVNKRFIRHPYLNHALIRGYDQLIPESVFPTYFVFFDVDPKTIDINIHPTKTEIKFQDEKLIYSILGPTTKKALAQHHVTPEIDFDVEKSLELPYAYKDKMPVPPNIKVNPNYNPFTTQSAGRDSRQHWEKLFNPGFPIEQAGMPAPGPEQATVGTWQQTIPTQEDNENIPDYPVSQYLNKYLVTLTPEGIVVINQQSAHERVLFDHFHGLLSEHRTASQQQLFPETVVFSLTDMALIKELTPDLELLGFRFKQTDDLHISVTGVPEGIPETNLPELFEEILEHHKRQETGSPMRRQEKMALSMAKKLGIKAGRKLEIGEMRELIRQLNLCSNRQMSPSGNKISVMMEQDEIHRKIN